MTAMWVLFSTVILMQVRYYAAGVVDKTTSGQLKTAYKQSEDDILLKESSGSSKGNKKNVKCNGQDCVSQEEFEEVVSSLQATIEQLRWNTKQLYEEQQQQLNQQQQQLNNFKQQTEVRLDDLEDANKVIGFTAYSTRRMDITHGRIVPYNSVGTNQGGAYNQNTHKFTCPVKGLYLFTVSTFTAGDHSVVQLMKNNVGLIGALADQRDWDQGSSTWVVNCNQGDQIWVRVTNDRAIAPPDVLENDTWLNSFAGVLIAVMK